MASMHALVALLLLLIPASAELHLRRQQQPLTEAELRASGDTGYPCVASGPMVEVCSWYFKFVRENPKPPKSIKEPFIFGGTKEWHTPDEDVTKACEANYQTICVQKYPTCDEYFELCDAA